MTGTAAAEAARRLSPSPRCPPLPRACAGAPGSSPSGPPSSACPAAGHVGRAGARQLRATAGSQRRARAAPSARRAWWHSRAGAASKSATAAHKCVREALRAPGGGGSWPRVGGRAQWRSPKSARASSVARRRVSSPKAGTARLFRLRARAPSDVGGAWRSHVRAAVARRRRAQPLRRVAAAALRTRRLWASPPACSRAQRVGNTRWR